MPWNTVVESVLRLRVAPSPVWAAKVDAPESTDATDTLSPRIFPLVSFVGAEESATGASVKTGSMVYAEVFSNVQDESTWRFRLSAIAVPEIEIGAAKFTVGCRCLPRRFPRRRWRWFRLRRW